MFNHRTNNLLSVACVAVLSLLVLGGCSEDEIVNNNDVVPKICNLDLEQPGLTGAISVTYSITHENGGKVLEVTFIDSDGEAKVIANPDLPWTRAVARPDGGAVGFQAEVEVTDRDSKISASVTGTSDDGATAIDESDFCEK